MDLRPASVYELLFAQSGVGECLLSPSQDPVILAVNDAFLRTAERTRDELVGKRLFDAFPDDPADGSATSVAALRGSLVRVLQTGRADTLPAQRYPVPAVLPDGSSGFDERFWHATNTPVVDAAGALICIAHKTEDITASFRLTEQLQDSKRQLEQERTRLQAIIDTIPTGLMMLDAQGATVIENAQWKRTWASEGLPAAVVQQGHNKGFRPETGKAIAADEWPSALSLNQGIETRDVVLDIERFDGSRGTIVVSSSPLRDAAGRVVGAVAANMDITELRAAQARLAHEQSRQRQMLQQMPGFAALLSGPEHRFVFVNDAYVDIAGPRGFLGRSVREVFPELASQGFFELLDSVYQRGEPFAARALPVSLARDGGERVVDLLYQPIRNDDGVVSGIFVGGYDVTEAQASQRAERASSERQAFRLRLEHHLRDSADAAAAIATVATALGELLHADQVAYGAVTGVSLTLSTEWSSGRLQSIVGAHAMQRYGAAYVAQLLAGNTCAVDDVRLDSRTNDPAALTAYAAIGVASFLTVPLLQDGRLVAVLTVNHGEPRAWTAAQIAIAEESANRLWQAVTRLRGEAALRRSEERYRTLFEAIDVGFCIVQMQYDDTGRATDYRLVEINPAFERQTGLVGAQGKWVSEVAPGLERHWFDIYGGVGLTGTPVRFENLAEPFGRWYDVRAFRTGAASEHLVAILFNDITDRRTAEDALRQLNERLESEVAVQTAERDRMWDTSADLLLVLDRDGAVRRTNPAWTTLLGYAASELTGKQLIDFMVDADEPETLSAHRALVTGVGVKLENRYRHKNGSARWISWTAAPAEDAIYATGRDVTADTELAEELASAQEALRQSQKMEAVGQLTGGLAHDFNNLLAGISGSLELILMRMRQGRVGEIDKYVSAAQGATKRAAALTHRLLAFSRRQTLAPKPTDIRQLVAGMEELIARTVGPAISVQTVHAAGVWPSLIDPSQLENAILNLCINARDAMPDGGTITVETANRWLDARTARDRGLDAGPYVLLSVTDTGTGMTPAVISKAFDPFFTTKPIGLGTGLGLSMIYGFAKQSGGTVSIESAVGQGSTLCIHLPRYQGTVDNAEGNAHVNDTPRAQAGETVLVVDDEPTVRMLVTEVLDDLGYAPLEAGDGAEGLRILNTAGRIDLLVTDVGLPGGMNGRQLADAARQLRPGLKILFITGYAENAVLGHGHLDPGMHVLTKPFAMEALGSRIRALIETGTRSPDGPGSLGLADAS